MRTLRYLFLDELAAMFDAEQRIVERAQANNNEERTKGKVLKRRGTERRHAVSAASS